MFKLKFAVQIIFTCAAATLATALIVSAATTIGSNITTDGTLGVTGLTTLVNASSTQLTATGSAYLATTGGRVGIGTANPMAKIHVGNGTTNNSSDSQILISRAVDDSVSGNGHAFSDSSNVSRSGTVGYASYDARITFSGSNNFDHYAAFQAAQTYSSSGTISNTYGLYTKGTITSGTITNNYGIYAASPLYTAGTLTNNWGLYVEPQVAASNNYAAAFMGKVGIGNSTPAYILDILGINPRISLFDSGTSYTMIKLGNTGTGAMYFGREGNTGGNVLTGSSANSGILTTGGGAYSMQFGTNGVLRMTIEGTNGNVGIGTTTPAAKLDVNGLARVYQSATTTCAAAIEGSIFYNSENKHFWGCDGTNWSRLDN